jgi:hypothetical protein
VRLDEAAVGRTATTAEEEAAAAAAAAEAAVEEAEADPEGSALRTYFMQDLRHVRVPSVVVAWLPPPPVSRLLPGLLFSKGRWGGL